MNGPIKRFFRKIARAMRSFWADVRRGDLISILILCVAALIFVVLIALLVFLPGRGNANSDTPVSTSQPESIAPPTEDEQFNHEENVIETTQYSGTILPATADAGASYIEQTLFIGDSNTSRMVLYGPATLQNTLGVVSMGIQHVTGTPCIYFAGNAQPVKVAEAVKQMQPRRIVMNYGTNNTSMTVESFISSYKAALDAIHAAYPSADIIIGAIMPVAKERSYPSITMQKIAQFNQALVELAQQEGYTFLNSIEAMADETTGFAKAGYMIEDGIHISETGMAAYFEYVRTHASDKPDTRPALTTVPTHVATADNFFTGGGSSSSASSSASSSSSDALSFALKGAAVTVGKSVPFNATDYKPDFSAFSGKTITWASSDPAIATVDKDGIVKGIAPGTVTITCTIGTTTAKATITVKADPVQIVISGTSTITTSQTSTLTVKITPDTYAGEKKFTWTSSNPEVATVAGNGASAVVTPVVMGKTTITVSMDGVAKTTYMITVNCNHNWQAAYDDPKTVAATCAKEGNLHWYCNLCQGTKDETVPKVAHSWIHDKEESKKTPATCTTEGVDVYWCPVCETADKRPVPALGHSYRETDGICNTCGEKNPNWTPPAPSSSTENPTEEPPAA